MTQLGTNYTYVVVTTSTRDVWFGLFRTRTEATVVLTEARHGYQWDTELGLGQLTTRGPGAKAKIGVELFGRIEILNATCVMDCGPDAVKTWQEARWDRS